MNTLAERLAALSPEQRERISQRLKLRSGTTTAQIPTQSRTTNAFPLSFTQQRLWFLDQLEPGNPFYNIPSAFRLTGKLDIAVLKQSLSELAQRHEALRTTFTQEADAHGGQPVQVIAAAIPIAFTMIDLRAQPAADREAETTRRILDEAQQPFDLVQGPLWRTLVMQLDEQEYVAVFTMHHIIFDGWSLGVFVRELTTLYTALMTQQPIPLPNPMLQYADYAHWQRQWFQGEVKDKQLAYWKEHLGGDLPLLDLPADRPRPLAQTFQGAAHSVLLPWSLYLALKDLGRQHETTLFMTFLTAFKTLLYRYTDQEDIIVGFPISGRNRQETEGVLGPFVNTLALRANLGESPRFLDLLGQVRAVTLGAYANQDVPFDLLVEVLQPERNLSYNPLFQVMFTYQNSLSTMELPDLTMRFLPVDCGTAKFDLSLDVYEGPDGPTCVFEYNTDLYDADRIRRMATHFQTLLEGIVADPHQRIADLPLIPAAEQALLETWNETTTDYELERGFIQSFEAQVQRTPTAVAATDEQESLTYAELNQRANRIAHKLSAYGVGPDAIVPLLAERSTHFLTAILAVLKAGGAYLPLDPHHPPARIAQILDQSDARLILTTQEFLNVVPAALDQRESSAEVWTVFIETLLHTSQQDENPPSRSTAQHLAYVLFTSGSTGTPKGVMIEHAGMLNHLLVMNEQMALGTDTTVAQTASQCFDISVWQFLSVLLVGGRVHIVSDETVRDPVQLIGTVAEQSITILEVVPSLLNAMLDELTEGTADDQALASLRWLIPTGETLTPELCRRWLRLYPAIPLLNAYGPAECADDVTLYPIVTPPATDTRFMPIGHPVANMHAYILDQHQHPVPVGVCGELYIGGVGVGRGYLNDILRTTEAFLLDPFADQPGARLYKTGDLARYDGDGNIVFLGRADYQVKVRGFRIELGEIEAQLCRHTAVHEAVVVAWEGDRGDKQLVGYVVADMAAVSREGLITYLKERLPEYMVPSALMLLETLPRTATGKVDRRALPAPAYQQSIATGSFIGPRTRIEEMLAELWHQAFGIKQISIYDDFFRLGGHSLLAIQLMTQVRRVFQVDIPLKYLFQAPTIAGFASIIAECQGQQRAYREGIDSIPVITPDTAGQYTPFPLTEVQQAYWIGRSEAFELGNVSTHNYDELEFENLNLPRLMVAWQQLIERHGMLRAIVLPDGQQQILAHVPPYDIAVLDLRGKDTAEVDERITALRQEMSHQILTTDEWPVFDLRVTLLDDQRARLHLSTDSLTFDAWSFVVLMRELVQLHEQPEVPLPPVDLSFRDYVLAERSLHHTPQYQRSYDYWQEIIPTLPPAPALPLVKNPSTIERPRFTRLHATLDAERWGRLKTKATRLGLTPTGILLAAYAEILTAWSKSPQFTLNLTFLNRLPIHPQVNDIVGEFTSLTLLAVDNGTPDTFAVRARRAQERLWDDLEHYHVSGIWVLRELKRRQGGVTSAKMPIVFTSALTLPIPDVHDAPLSLRPVHSITQTSQVYLDCGVWEDARTLLCNWDVVEELFPDGLLQEMFAAFWQLVERLADEDDIWQQTSVSLVPVAQIEQRTQTNTTDAPVPTAMLHELFAAQVEQCPQHAAVITPTQTLTYAEVEQRANQLGRQLRENGAQPNQLVAVVMEKGWEQVVGTLAVLKAGAAYLPIDPELPQERIWYLLEHGQVELVLTQSWIDTHVTWPTFVQRLCVDTAPCTAPDSQPLAAVQGPDDLAYVIFTSGSTGLPKGVMINHRGAVNTIVDCNQRFGLTSIDRVLALSALNFDLSVYDIFGTLAAGGTIIMPCAADRRDPAHWFDLVQREQVTLWNSVPALMNLLIDYVEHTNRSLPASLRLVMLSGDWIPLSLPERIKARGQAVSVYSLGGATEASIWSILYPIETVDPAWQSIPYGRPMVNQRFYVLNHALEPCPIWVAGQLYIGGVGLALGYWRDLEKTDASFITHPNTGERLYRAGDLGRYLPDGTIEFLGREDSQVKIQGHRIELGEIEAALLQHPDVQHAIVLVTGATSGSKRLAAYVVPHPGQCCDRGDLRRFLQGKLPEYMVPPTFTCLDALPLTPNGKVDRKALAGATHGEPTQDERGATPQTPVEQTLAQIWAELLEVEQVGVTDNFFELGGDSILAVHAVTRMREAFDVSFPLRDFFIQPVIADLAAFIEEQCAVCAD